MNFFQLFFDVFLNLKISNLWYIELMENLLMANLINPINWNPLVLMTQQLQCIKHLTEGLIEVLIYDDHVKVFFVFSLKHH